MEAQQIIGIEVPQLHFINATRLSKKAEESVSSPLAVLSSTPNHIKMSLQHRCLTALNYVIYYIFLISYFVLPKLF